MDARRRPIISPPLADDDEQRPLPLTSRTPRRRRCHQRAQQNRAATHARAHYRKVATPPTPTVMTAICVHLRGYVAPCLSCHVKMRGESQLADIIRRAGAPRHTATMRFAGLPPFRATWSGRDIGSRQACRRQPALCHAPRFVIRCARDIYFADGAPIHILSPKAAQRARRFRATCPPCRELQPPTSSARNTASRPTFTAACRRSFGKRRTRVSARHRAMPPSLLIARFRQQRSPPQKDGSIARQSK